MRCWAARSREREPGRYRISYVPARIRNRAKELGTTVPVWEQYDRVCFDKELMNQAGLPEADFICPGHPLLDTVDRPGAGQAPRDAALRRGAGRSDRPRHRAARALLPGAGYPATRGPAQSGDRARASPARCTFVEIDEEGDAAGRRLCALPGLPPGHRRGTGTDCRTLLAADWLSGEGLEEQVVAYAVEHLVPAPPGARARAARGADRQDAGRRARAADQRDQLLGPAGRRTAPAGKGGQGQRPPERAPGPSSGPTSWPPAWSGAPRSWPWSGRSRPRRRWSSAGRWWSRLGCCWASARRRRLLDTRITEAIAMQAVMQAETELGNHPRDVSKDNLGYDIESLDPRTGRLRFIEVKGGRGRAVTVTRTRS